MKNIAEKIKTKCIEKNLVANVSAVLAVAFLYGGMQLVGITCPIKYMTGISCAGCGMTRAYLSLLHLQFENAFYYHPLFWLPPVFLLCYLRRKNMNKNFYRILMISFLVLFLAVYFYRMFFGDGMIVVCKPKEGSNLRFINIFI